MHEFQLQLPISKLDEAKRLVTGWASIAKDEQGRYVIDAQGDHVPIDELEKAGFELVRAGGHGRGGDMHKRLGVADIVELITLTVEKRTALKMGEGPEGMVITMKINDDKLWGEILAGRKLELSIAGTAERTAL